VHNSALSRVVVQQKWPPTTATTVAGEAIAFWLRARKKVERQNAIAAYAAEMVGTQFDLDKSLESAAIVGTDATDPKTNRDAT
jgi:hypothetical protein